MAAFGILAALRERDRSGEGQFVDVSMADGALSWLAMVAGALLRRRRGAAARRPGARRDGSSATAPTRARDGWVTLGALEPKFWQAWCRGVGPRGPDREAVRARRARRRTPRSSGSSSSARATSGRPFASEHDCCLEPVLDLDEALDSELVRAREMVVELDQPGAGQGEAARRAGEAVAHAGRGAGARARCWASTPTRCWRAAGYSDEEIGALKESRRGRGPGGRGQGLVHGMRRDGDRSTAC